MNIVVRELRAADYDALTALWHDAGLQFKPLGRDGRDRIERQIAGSNAVFLVAEMDGRLIGSVLATHDGRKGWINRLAVAPEFRRQGVAKRLVAEVESRLSERGIEIIACLIEGSNMESVRVLERLGYDKHPSIVYFTKRRDSEV